MILTLSVCIITFILTLILVPYVNRIGKAFQILDKPSKRKIHNKEIVRIGGLALFISFIFGFFLFIVLNNFFELNYYLTKISFIIIISSTLFFLIGLADDSLNLSPFKRLLFQFIISSFLWANGLNIESIDLSFLNKEPLIINTGLSYFITIIWFSGITNAINWIDGIDGLASVFTAITSLSLSFIFSTKGFIDGTLLSLLTFVISLGFFIFNRKPAKILMGDGGSYLLGINLATLTILSGSNINESTDIRLPLILLSYPLIDMIYVIFSRLLDGISPFYGDKRHLHHRLLNIFKDEKKVVRNLSILTLITSITAYLIVSNNNNLV